MHKHSSETPYRAKRAMASAAPNTLTVTPSRDAAPVNLAGDEVAVPLLLCVGDGATVEKPVTAAGAGVAVATTGAGVPGTRPALPVTVVNMTCGTVRALEIVMTDEELGTVEPALLVHGTVRVVYNITVVTGIVIGAGVMVGDTGAGGAAVTMAGF